MFVLLLSLPILSAAQSKQQWKVCYTERNTCQAFYIRKLQCSFLKTGWFSNSRSWKWLLVVYKNSKYQQNCFGIQSVTQKLHNIWLFIVFASVPWWMGHACYFSWLHLCVQVLKPVCILKYFEGFESIVWRQVLFVMSRHRDVLCFHGLDAVWTHSAVSFHPVHTAFPRYKKGLEGISLNLKSKREVAFFEEEFMWTVRFILAWSKSELEENILVL